MYACIDEKARLKWYPKSSLVKRALILDRDEEARKQYISIISQDIINIGSSSHPNWTVRFTYSDGSVYLYHGGSYHG